MKVLIVDDSPVMRKVLAEALTQCGVEDVRYATDGQQAIDLAGSHDFSFIIMDWNLPALSGVEAVRVLREQGRSVPVIIVAGEDDRDRVLEALKTGADGFLIKPFDTATVVAKVNAVMAQVAKR